MEEKQDNPEEKYLVIGYGTFIIKAATGDNRFKEIGICKVKDYHRLFHPKFQHLLGYWYPFAVRQEKSFFRALVYEVSAEDLKSLDNYEGAPGFFMRTTCNVSINGKEEKAQIYVPSEYTYNRIKEELFEFFTENERIEVYKKDFWLEYMLKFHEYLKEKYPELFK